MSQNLDLGGVQKEGKHLGWQPVAPPQPPVSATDRAMERLGILEDERRWTRAMLEDWWEQTVAADPKRQAEEMPEPFRSIWQMVSRP